MPQNKNTYEASVSKSSANTNTSREDAEKDGGYDKTRGGGSRSHRAGATQEEGPEQRPVTRPSRTRTVG